VFNTESHLSLLLFFLSLLLQAQGYFLPSSLSLSNFSLSLSLSLFLLKRYNLSITLRVYIFLGKMLKKRKMWPNRPRATVAGPNRRGLQAQTGGKAEAEPAYPCPCRSVGLCDATVSKATSWFRGFRCAPRGGLPRSFWVILRLLAQ